MTHTRLSRPAAPDFLIRCLALLVILLLAGYTAARADAADRAAEGLEIHFLDVGQGDAAILLCGGQAMMIDGGNPSDSGLIFSYLKNTLGLSHLDILIATHPHDDHIGGLPAALNACTAGAIYSPVPSYYSERFEDLMTYADRQGIEITVPRVGDRVHLGDAAVEFLSPHTFYGEVNNWSLVVRVVYGDTAFLFAGDAEKDAEANMLKNGDLTLQSTLLKVGHHGSDTSSTAAFLEQVAPQYAVISVGADNSHGHPDSTVLKRLTDMGVSVYRTDLCGTILCTSDGTNLAFSFETQPAPQADPTPQPTPQPAATPLPATAPQAGSGETEYVLNTNSKKFHYPHCRSVSQMKESNRAYYTGHRDDLISQGYSPCGSCKP